MYAQTWWIGENDRKDKVILKIALKVCVYSETCL